MELTFEINDLSDENDDLKKPVNYPSDDRYLKCFVPLSRQSGCPAPLGLRRSVSLEDTSIEKNLIFYQKCKPQNNSNLSLPNSSSLSNSLKSLCFHLRPYQLLPEYHQNIEESDNQHQFDWWNTIDHLRPLIENIILYENLQNHFEDDQNQQDQNLILFQKSKRKQRRNAVCFAIDRLFYNQQMILFVAITNELQIEFNLMSSGFKM